MLSFANTELLEKAKFPAALSAIPTEWFSYLKNLLTPELCQKIFVIGFALFFLSEIFYVLYLLPKYEPAPVYLTYRAQGSSRHEKDIERYPIRKILTSVGTGFWSDIKVKKSRKHFSFDIVYSNKKYYLVSKSGKEIIPPNREFTKFGVTFTLVVPSNVNS